MADISNIDLTKPNPHLHEPLFEGLSWTACDFSLLGSYLSEMLISYIEDGDGPFEKEAMDRLLQMSDECSDVVQNSAYFKEHHARLQLKKQMRETAGKEG